MPTPNGIVAGVLVEGSIAYPTQVEEDIAGFERDLGLRGFCLATCVYLENRTNLTW